MSISNFPTASVNLFDAELKCFVVLIAGAEVSASPSRTQC